MDKKKERKFDPGFWLGSAFMIAMVVAITIQVIFRFAGHPLSWPEEVARWFLIYITFTGASYAFRNGGLISVDFFIRKLFPKQVNKITAVGYGVSMLYFGFLAFSAVKYIQLTVKKTQFYPITKMPYWPTVLAVVIGAVLVLIFFGTELVKKWKEPEGGQVPANVERGKEDSAHDTP